MADDEDDDDDEQHHGDGVIATLVRRNRVVTLRRLTDRSKDEAVQDDQDLPNHWIGVILVHFVNAIDPGYCDHFGSYVIRTILPKSITEQASSQMEFGYLSSFCKCNRHRLL